MIWQSPYKRHYTILTTLSLMFHKATLSFQTRCWTHWKKKKILLKLPLCSWRQEVQFLMPWFPDFWWSRPPRNQPCKACLHWVAVRGTVHWLQSQPCPQGRYAWLSNHHRTQLHDLTARWVWKLPDWWRGPLETWTLSWSIVSESEKYIVLYWNIPETLPNIYWFMKWKCLHLI